MPLSGEYAPSTADWAREQAEQFEATGGLQAAELRGMRIIVLTTLGARTGKLRKTALMRVEHDGQYAIVGSMGGAPTNPSWVHNVRRQPHVELQDGPDKHDYLAHEADGPERAQWWERAVAAFPQYADYQLRTERVIPVFVLARSDA